MRPLVPALASIAVVALLGPPGHAQDKPAHEDAGETRDAVELARAGATRLPANPFAEAKAGDWWVYTEKTLAPDSPAVHATVVWSVLEVDGDDLRVKEEVKGEGTAWLEKSRWFSRQDAPTLADVLPFASRVRGIFNVNVEEQRRTANGEDFDCKRLSFALRLEGKTQLVPAALWLSPVSKGAIVALVARRDGLEGTKVKLELAGYGAGDKAEWGRTPAQVQGEGGR